MEWIYGLLIRILIVIVIAAFFLMLGYMLEKKIAKQREMQEEEVRYSIEIIKNELSDLPIYKLDRNNQYAEK